jgi:hypothetical protein
MSFIRPQARAAIWRWREVLAASGVLALGAYWTFGLNGGVLHWLGFVVLGIGAIAMVSGLQRVRFRGHRGGVGVVSIDEGQVSYFGPLSGGVIAMREMTKLALDPTMEPPHWCLTQIGEQTFRSMPRGRMRCLMRFQCFRGSKPKACWPRCAAARFTLL